MALEAARVEPRASANPPPEGHSQSRVIRARVRPLALEGDGRYTRSARGGSGEPRASHAGMCARLRRSAAKAAAPAGVQQTRSHGEHREHRDCCTRASLFCGGTRQVNLTGDGAPSGRGRARGGASAGTPDTVRLTVAQIPRTRDPSRLNSPRDFRRSNVRGRRAGEENTERRRSGRDARCGASVADTVHKHVKSTASCLRAALRSRTRRVTSDARGRASVGPGIRTRACTRRTWRTQTRSAPGHPPRFIFGALRVSDAQPFAGEFAWEFRRAGVRQRSTPEEAANTHPAHAAAGLWITVHTASARRRRAWLGAAIGSRRHERAGVLDDWRAERERATVRRRRGQDKGQPKP